MHKYSSRNYPFPCITTVFCDVYYNIVVALLTGELTIAPSNSPPSSNTPPMGGGGGDGSPGGGRDSDQSPPPMNNQLSESQLSGGGGRSVVSGGSPFAVSANRDYHFSHIQHGQVPYTFNLPAHDYNPSNY